MNKVASTSTEQLTYNLLKEVRELRHAVSLVIPVESLAEYAHPKRIAASYKRAAKLHPPRR